MQLDRQCDTISDACYFGGVSYANLSRWLKPTKPADYFIRDDGYFYPRDLVEYCKDRKTQNQDSRWVETFEPIDVTSIEAKTQKEIQLARNRKRLVLQKRARHISKDDAQSQALQIYEAQSKVCDLLIAECSELHRIESRQVVKIMREALNKVIVKGGEMLKVDTEVLDFDDSDIKDTFDYQEATAAKEGWLARDRNLARIFHKKKYGACLMRYNSMC